MAHPHKDLGCTKTRHRNAKLMSAFGLMRMPGDQTKTLGRVQPPRHITKYVRAVVMFEECLSLRPAKNRQEPCKDRALGNNDDRTETVLGRR